MLAGWALAQFPKPVVEAQIGPAAAVIVHPQILRAGSGADTLLVAAVNFGTGLIGEFFG